MILIIVIFFFCSEWVISTTLSYRSLMYSSVSPNLLLIPSCVFFISVAVFFSSPVSSTDFRASQVGSSSELGPQG